MLYIKLLNFNMSNS